MSGTLSPSRVARRRLLTTVPLLIAVWPAIAIVVLPVTRTLAAELPDRDPGQILGPAANDFSAASLRAYLAAVRDHYGGADRDVPLHVKAQICEWILWRYHRNARSQIDIEAELPVVAGVPPLPGIGSDTSTWNGALLMALSYKYAVMRDPQTLRRIVALLDGLRFYTTVTGRPGCYARCVVPANIEIRANERKKFGVYEYVDGRGLSWSYLGNPAKGTYNQLAGGYASFMALVADDLPTEVQAAARQDVANLVSHVLSDDYHLRGPDGRRTPHGDLTPIVGSVGVPFNGQVAYLIVALGHYFGTADLAYQRSCSGQFRRLRDKRHVYYKDPRKSLIRPQRIGDNPLVKGMNDRNHVTNAAYFGLMLDVDQSRRNGSPPDRTFMYRLGRTMFWSMRSIGDQRNALCTFMWAGILNDVERKGMLLQKREVPGIEKRLAQGLDDGVEQLRRYPLDRFVAEGKPVATKAVQWVDQQKPDAYRWKADPKSKWHPTGPATNVYVAPIDYLAAYWVFRYHELQRHPAVQRHVPVLRGGDSR